MPESAQKLPVDRGWAWVILVASFVNSALVSSTYLSGLYNMVFLEVFEQNVALTSCCCSLHASILALSGPLTSFLIKLIGARITALIGSALVFLGYLVPSFVASFPVVFIFYGLVAGTGFGLTYLPFMVWMGFHFRKRRNLAFGLVTTAAGLGTFFLSPFLHYLIQEYGWQGSMTIMAGIMAHLFICASVLRPITFQIDEDDIISVEPHIADETALNTTKSIKPNNPISIIAGLDIHSEDPNMSQTQVHKSKPNCDLSCTQDTREVQQTAPCKVNAKLRRASSCLNLDQKSPELTLSHPNLCQNGVKMYASKENTYFSVDNVNFGKRKDQNETSQHVQNSVLTNGPLKKTMHLKPCLQISSETIARSMISINNPWFNYKDKEATHPEKEILTKERTSTTAASKWKDFVKEYRSLAHTKFLLFCANLLFVDIGLAIGYIFLPALAKANGSTDFQTAKLISLIGIANIVSRLLTGVATSSKDINTYVVYMSTCGIIGIIFFITPVLSRYYIGQAFLTVSFGVYGNVFPAMMSPITIDIAGISSLNVAHGAELLMCGIGYLIGPPIGGAVYEICGSFDSVIVLGGICYFVGSLMIMLIPLTSKEGVNL